MKTPKPTHLFFYRLRYVLGYAILIALVAGTTLIAGLYAPGSLTQQEINSLEITHSLNLSDPATLAVPDLPFHLLQHASFELFGVSILSIKLPAMLLATITGLALFFLLRRWFRPNVTILTLLITATTSQFMFVAQSGTPLILYVTYTALILLFASLIVQMARASWLWKFLLLLTISLSLYTPFFIYINIVLFLIGIIHPHTRNYIFRRIKSLNKLLTISLLIILILPLVYLCARTPQLLWSLTTIDIHSVAIVAHLKTLVQTYFWPHPFVSGGQMLPLMDFSAIALTLLGLMKTIQHHHTTRAYIIFTWLILSLPLLILQPHLTVIITAPLFILLAIGIETLMREWYRLFPRNPYARVTGLFMLICLIGVMVMSGIERYLGTYRYNPDIIATGSTDVTTFTRQFSDRDHPITVIASEEERPLYQLLSRYNYRHLTVTTSFATAEEDTVVVTHAARQTAGTTDIPLTSIVTNQRTTAADRFYIYTRP